MLGAVARRFLQPRLPPPSSASPPTQRSSLRMRIVIWHRNCKTSVADAVLLNHIQSKYYRTFFFNFKDVYVIRWGVVGLERGPLSLVSTTEELLGSKSSGSGLENREYERRNASRWPRGTLYAQKLALASPTSDGRSVGRVRSWTQATEFFCMSCTPSHQTAQISFIWGQEMDKGSRWRQVIPFRQIPSRHSGSDVLRAVQAFRSLGYLRQKGTME
jgi:hypothetical protein